MQPDTSIVLELDYEEVMWLEQAARFGARDTRHKAAAEPLDDLARKLAKAAASSPKRAGATQENADAA